MIGRVLQVAVALAAPAVAQDPADGEVPIVARAGWEGRLLLDTDGGGVWTVGAYPVFPQYASDEVVALDDEGRCHVLVSYSGKWTPFPRVHDGKWLGGIAHGDLDPRVDGAELYVGGESGNLYQVVAHVHGALDARLIGHFPGQEIHALAHLVDPDVDPARSTLLVFTAPGALHEVTPTGPHGRFEARELARTPSRVRDARVIRTRDGVRVVTAGREGRLGLLQLGPDGPAWTTVHRESIGFGRVTVRRSSDGPLVLYSTLDDGRVLRHEEAAHGWTTETVFAGPQGPRGIASGRFDEDPEVETVAVFGYSSRVTLLRREAAGLWHAETIFEDLDRGHWLTAAELDGRNGTDELVGSGYGARVFLLARPPGYGLDDLATDPDERSGSAAPPAPPVSESESE